MNGKCSLCLETGKLADAHIIPRPFFLAHGTEGRAPKVLSNSPGAHPKRSPTGFYDSGILCSACDGRLGLWDEYGVRLLLHELDQLTDVDGSGIGFQRQGYDYERLKLFFLSVLWRAHLASRPEFSRVRLGPHAGHLREMIVAVSPGSPDQYSVVLSAFTVNQRLPNFPIPIADPIRERWNGVNAYRLSFGVFNAYIKVDKLQFPSHLVRVMMRPAQPLLVVGRDWPTSSEARVVRNVAQTPENRRLFRRDANR